MSRDYDALMHNMEMLRNESLSIRASLLGVKIFNEDFTNSTSSRRRKTKVFVEQSTTEQAIFKYVGEARRIAALCFSDFSTLSKTYFKGDSGQAEDLCHVSTLYEVLGSCPKMAKALYLPMVTIISGDNKTMCDIITYQLSKNIASSVSFLLSIAAYQRVDTLILGAWGCGRAGQNPKQVANTFKEQITNQFREVVFAIPDSNYNTFKEIFADERHVT